MIDGLRLTMTGEELRKRLQERVKEHERQAAWYKAEATREPDPKDEYDVGLPEQMCEHEEERHAWRAEVLAYIREHIEGGEVYRLTAADLKFGEILPQPSGLVSQVEYEEKHRVGFSLERIAKEIGRRPYGLEYELAELAQRTRTVPDEPGEPKPHQLRGRSQRKRKQVAKT